MGQALLPVRAFYSNVAPDRQECLSYQVQISGIIPLTNPFKNYSIPRMKRSNFDDRIIEIVTRLTAISEADKKILLAPNPIAYLELEAYGDRFEERQRLYRELTNLASEPIE